MKKRTKIILSVLAVFLAGGIGLAAWQWNNLQALKYGLSMDTAALDEKIQENSAALDEAMERYQVEKYEITQDELAALTDGSLSPQEVARKLLESREPPKAAAPETPAGSQQTGEGSQSADPGQSGAASSVPLSAEEQEIQQLIATMYVLQASYEEKLNAEVQGAIDEYLAGEHTSENRTRVVYKRIEGLLAMEKECDAQVAQVVSRLRELLKATGQSEDLAKQAEAAYQQEKSLKKAYYLNAFRGG